MKIDNKKYFMRLPFYLVIVYFLASIPITIYLAQNVTQSKQYAQSYPSATPEYVSPTFNCLANACPTGNSNPTVYEIVSSAPSAPSGIESTSAAPNPSSPLAPSIDPCVSSNSVSVQDYSTTAHGGGNGGRGFIEFFINFLKYLLNLISQILGYPPVGTGAPAPSSNPCPTGVLVPTISGETLSPIPSKVILTSTPAITSGTNGGKNANVKITFYTGFETNGGTNGGLVAHSLPGRTGRAGGAGTYADPLTVAASERGNYPVGTKIYVPLVQKYFIREDGCPGCTASQLDLYIGNPSNSKVAADCAGALTTAGTTAIIINPPSNLTYDSKKIWDQSTGTCMMPHR